MAVSGPQSEKGQGRFDGATTQRARKSTRSGRGEGLDERWKMVNAGLRGGMRDEGTEATTVSPVVSAVCSGSTAVVGL